MVSETLCPNASSSIKVSLYSLSAAHGQDIQFPFKTFVPVFLYLPDIFLNRHTPLEDLLPSTKTGYPAGRGVRIPVLGRVVAGIPIEAVEEILDYEEITPELAATGEFFALKIRGHSMEPRMMEGDVVIVRKQEDVESGDVAIVLVNGNEATVKRVKKQEEGITLIATNTSVYEPHFYSNKEIKNLSVQILGKVVELRGKF